MKKEQIAPCGMNCAVCIHYLKAKNKCPGCRSGRIVNNRCVTCRRKFCNKRTGEYCFSCAEFPCKSIQVLDKRYREKYGMSEIDNLIFIRDHGIEKFLRQEEKRWVGKEGVLCVHDKKRYKAK